MAREKSDEVIDLTKPDSDRIEKRAGTYLREFSEAFQLDSVSNNKSSKRKNENDDPTVKKVKSNDSIDVEAEARAGRVKNCSFKF